MTVFYIGAQTVGTDTSNSWCTVSVTRAHGPPRAAERGACTRVDRANAAILCWM